MARNLQKELSLAEKRQKDATEIERIANEKAQFVTDLQKHLERTQNTLQRKDDLIQGMHHKYSDLHSKYIPQQQLQTNLERMQDKSHQKDVLIHRLQNELSQLKLQMHDKTQRLSVLDTPKDDVTSVPIRIAKPAVISKRNTEPLQGTATPEAIPISDITSTAIEPPHIQPQVQLVSVPLSIADPTPMTSKRNAPIHGKVIAQSILTNDPLTASTEVLKPAHAMTMEQDAIPTQYIASVPLCPAAPTSKVSKRNTYERSSYTQPQSIPTNDPLDASTEVLKPAHAMVMDQDVIPTQYIASVPLRPAAATTKVSKRNTPPLASYTQPQAIPTNDPLNASVEVLKPAHAMAIDTNVIPTPYTASVPFCSAAPTSKISKRNTPKLPSYAQPQSIEINTAKAPSFSLLTAPQQRVLFVEDEADDLPPKRPSKPPLPPRDTDKPRRYKPYPTKFRISVPEKTRIVEAVVVPPLSVAQPTLATSKRNPPNIREITPSSIDINDPTQGSETMIAAPPQLVTTDALHLPSVPLSVAEPVSVVSKRNQPRIKYVTPSSIDINDVSLTSESVVAVPQQLGSVIDSALSRPIPTANTASIPLSAAQPRSAISKRNLPKPEYIPPSAITISDPNTTSQHVVSVPTEIATEAVMPSVSLQVAEPISPISRRNESKINYVTPSSIAINDVFTTAETVIAAPPQASMDDSNVIAEQAVSAPFHVDPSQIEAVTDSLPPKDMIATAHIPSVALRKAEPIPLDISSRNVSKPGEIVAASIAINDVTTAKRVLSRPAASLRPNRSVIASPCPESVHGRRISFLHLIGTPPAPCIKTEYMAHSPHMWHPQDTHPALIPVNEPETLLPKVVLQPPRVLLDVSLRAAPLISNLSRHNQPKLGYKRASSIHTSTITDDTLNHPSKQTQLIDSSKLVQDLLNLKQLHGTQEGAVDSELDIDPEPILTEIPEAEPEPELQSGLTAVDIDRVFECRTNSDLLFDDVVHFETIFLGLDAELRDYLSECRECKSITNPLPSTFRRDIADLRPDESNVFNGDVVCCVQWEVDNKHLLTIMDDIDGLMHKCEEHIDSNRALMEEYRRVMRNDEICSTSNRNKLKKQMNGQNKKEINDIEKEKKSEFGNDLSEELLELQYKNSEWFLLRETLAEWKGFIESAQRSDSGAFNSSDKLYLRSFCILPSQEQSARNHLTNRLNRIDHELRNRRWVKELNHLLSNEHNCNVLYGEMGPDVASWEDKLLARDLTAYLLNGAAFELHSTVSSRIPLSEGFVRIGYQAQLLIESAQSLLGHMDPFVERIIIEAQNWCNRNNKVYGNHPQKTLESSLKNGLDLSSIDALTLRDKMPLLRGKLLENDTKYQSLFGEPLHTNLDELLHEMNTRTIDHKYIAKLHTFLSDYFCKLYRDKLMLPTPNSGIIEETACETWQKHALLCAVCSDEFDGILQLLSNESLAQQLCHFTSHNVFSSQSNAEQESKKEVEKQQMFNELFAPFATLRDYHATNIKHALYQIVSDFDISQYISEKVYQNALQETLSSNKWSGTGRRGMSFADKLLAPQPFVRDEAQGLIFTAEEGLATYWTGYLKGVLHAVPVERPMRLAEHYHDISVDEHLGQHYYVDSYKPPSHEDVATRISCEDKMNGVDIYRDRYIQRPHQSKRILQTKLTALYHNKSDYMRGAFPLENFNYLPYATQKPIKHRVTVRKSPFVQARAQENYETRIYSKIATNYKLTSNRTADMFNARGFDIIYDSVRVM
eukprot:1146472_1